MNTPVSDLLESKGHEVICIAPDRSVYDAVSCMSERSIGCLVVSQDNQTPLGIIAEHDCRGVVVEERNPRSVPVEEVMTRDLVAVDPSKTIEQCMQLMTEHRVRHLPVLRHGVLVGMISIGDVVKFLSEERGRMIENLEKYITGSI